MASERVWLSRIDARDTAVERCEKMLEMARTNRDRTLLEANLDGVPIAAIARHRGTSWTRVSAHVKRAATERRISLVDAQMSQ